MPVIKTDLCINICTSFICLVIDCGDPGTLSNGSRIGSVFTFGGTVRYTCNHGYRLSGSSIRTCEASERWSGDKAVCRGNYYVEHYMGFVVQELYSTTE